MIFRCISIICVFLSLNVNAQKVIGIKVGMNRSSLQLQKVYKSTNSRLGLNLGIDYLQKINSSFDFESGLYYIQKGQKYHKDLFSIFLDGTIANVKETNEYQLDYLQLPLNLNYKFNSNLFVIGGIYLAYGLEGDYIVKRKSSFQGTKKDEQSTYKEKLPVINNNRVFKKSDFGFTFGGGYRFGRFCAKAVFNMGLKNVLLIEDPLFINPQKMKYKNSSLSLDLVYYLSDNYFKIRF